MGRRAEVFGADFNDSDQALALATYAIKTLGAINCLVNNAGVSFNRPFLKMEPDHVKKLFNINFLSHYFITQSVVTDMLEHQGGTVVSLASIHGLQGAPEHTAYAATKGAIIAHTRALAVEVAHRGPQALDVGPAFKPVQNVRDCFAQFPAPVFSRCCSLSATISNFQPMSS